MAHQVEPTDIRHLQDEHLMCRTLGHSWDQIPDDGGGGHRSYEESRTVRRVLFRCERCHLHRYEAWSAVTGDILFRTYDYPDGYKMTREDSGRTLMRVEWVRRLGTYQAPPSKRAVRAGRNGNGKH